MIRERLEPQVYQLIARMNEFIQAALPEIKKKGFRDIVLIIDNLDRIVLRVLDAETARTTHDALYLEHAEQLKALDAIPDLHCAYIYVLLAQRNPTDGGLSKLCYPAND